MQSPRYCLSFFGIAFFMFLAPGLVVAQVTVCFDAEDPPFMFATPNHKPAGLYPALFSEAFQRMGVEAELKAVPWKRAIEGCDSGDNGVGGIYQSKERLEKYDYSSPFYEERIGIYSLAIKKFQYKNLEDLYGKNVAVIRGWSYGDAFDAAVKAGKIKIDDSDGDSTNFKKLSAVRVDVALAVWESGEKEITDQGLEKDVQRMPVLLTTNGVYLAFNKTKNLKATLSKFDNAIASMKKDGTFDTIVKAAFSK